MSRDAETMATTAAPSPKRAKLSHDGTDDSAPPPLAASTENLPIGLPECLALLSDEADLALPPTLTAGGPTRNDIPKLRRLFDAHGFRTSVVTSPRSALSIYRESCSLDGATPGDLAYAGRKFLISMLGLHPDQGSVERWYAASIREIYCLLLFCARVREACPEALGGEGGTAVRRVVELCEAQCRSAASPAKEAKGAKISGATKDAAEPPSSPKGVADPSPVSVLQALSSACRKKVADLISCVVAADPRIRSEQLQHEYDRIAVRNSTYSNALVQLFLDAQRCDVKDVYFKRSHVPKYERITVYLYDPEIDPLRPPRFTFLPALRRAIDNGPEALADDMVESFWSNLLRHGYFATKKIRSELTPDLTKFFLSGIADNLNIPLLLNAHFTPKYPLSFYLHGQAGAGKSSFVRNFSPALNAAVEEMADPEILVRFVKQNLNKPYSTLELEMELRPNNNDLSVMSIIQGRRMTLAQSKPGLVVVDLEEMASNADDADPNQLKTCRLLSQRFSGQNGDFREGRAGKAGPRNSDKRGISGDATLLTLFTSNYPLGEPCWEALQRLQMFSNLKCIETTAVSGKDRVEFAKTYLGQCVRDRFLDLNPVVEVDLKILVGSGDTRPLVRHLRMLAFYVCALAKDGVTVGSSVVASVAHDDVSDLTTVSCGGASVMLKVGSFENLYPETPKVFDARAVNTVKELQKLLESKSAGDFAELSQIVDYYFAKTLAPAVIVSNDADLIQNIVAAVASQRDVHTITNVDAGSYKMMKSLYDPNDMPNLRDDILKFGRGAYVAVELKCGSSRDAQLCIREIIEDSPSMTAFSTSKSALYKEGLLFAVHVEGDITPEVKSRASLIL